MDWRVAVGLGICLVAIVGSGWASCVGMRERAAAREVERSKCASRGGHLHCPYRADCLCLAPGMVVP
jgi:hypothetical protein